MHEDVTDGVRALRIKSHLADPDRMAIMGGSFGGYLAICGAAYEGPLYRCAITVAGIFDWEQVMREAQNEQGDSAQYGSLKRNLGDPKQHHENFDNISPIRAADRITIPIFVAHGREDRVASFEESKQLVRALEKHSIPHEVMFADLEDHGFSHVENQVALYTRIEAFLARDLAPRPRSRGFIRERSVPDFALGQGLSHPPPNTVVISNGCLTPAARFDGIDRFAGVVFHAVGDNGNFFGCYRRFCVTPILCTRNHKSGWRRASFAP